MPEIGLKIIDSLAHPSAQLERLGHGIGLPIDIGLYVNDPRQYFPGNSKTRDLDPGRDLDVGEIVRGAYRRSHLFNYHRWAQILSNHLVNLLELPLTPDLAGRTRDRLVSNIDEVLDHAAPDARP